MVEESRERPGSRLRACSGHLDEAQSGPQVVTGSVTWRLTPDVELVNGANK